jgi:hypothetical protein
MEQANIKTHEIGLK